MRVDIDEPSTGARAPLDHDPLAPPRPPGWLVATKVALLALLLVGALFPGVGGFEGKGMAYRLPIFLAPALVVPAMWWRRRHAYRVPLDVALTVPFLLDTLGNAVGLYDEVSATDDVLHFVNWFVLVGGIALTLRAARSASRAPQWLILVAAGGVGAAAIILWEAAEYAVMRAGVGGLSLTYADTVADLLLSTAGGCLGAWVALRVVQPGSAAARETA